MALLYKVTKAYQATDNKGLGATFWQSNLDRFF